jgi:PAS domain S-box-containing protein
MAKEDESSSASSRAQVSRAAWSESELRYRIVADFTYDWEYWLAPDGSLRYVSPSCERITGYSAEEFRAEPGLLEELIVPADRQVWAEHRQELPGSSSTVIQFRILTRDGQTRWIEHICQSVIDDAGADLGLRVSNRDVTDRKLAEDELRQHRGQLEELVESRAGELARANEMLRAEVAERRRAEEALRRSEERYALAQRAASMGSWEWDIRTGDLYWSEQIEPMFGFAPGGFGGSYAAFLNTVHPEDRQRVMDAVDASVERGADYAIEHRIVWPDGTVRWVSETGDVLRDGQGQPLRMLGVVQDVTRRKQAEDSLRESEEKFRNVAEQSPSMVFIVLRDKIVYANLKCEALMGYLRKELYAPDFEFTRLLVPDCRTRVKDSFRAHLNGEAVPPQEYTFITKEGRPIDAILAKNRIQYQGKPAILGTVTDITERKQSEKALLESEARYRHLVESLQEGIWVLDAEGNTTFVNPRMAQMLGYAVDEMQGKHLFEFMDERQVELAQRNLERRRQGIHEQHDFEFTRKDGTAIYTSLATSPLTDSDGNYVGALAGIMDISDRRRAEEALREATGVAEAARREEAERRREAEQRRRIAEGLGDVLAVLNSDQSLDQVLDYIARQAGGLLGTRAAGIYSLDRETGTLSIRAARGLLAAYVAGAKIPIGQGALDRAMDLRQPVAVPDVAASLSRREGLVVPKGQATAAHAWTRVYRALLAVPIVVEGRVYGGMLLYYGEPRAFPRDEIELSVAFADQVALAIGNAQLKEQVRQAAMSAERDRLARDLHDAVTQTLFSAGLIAEAVPRVWERNPEDGRRGLEELRLLVRGAAAEMRTLLVELRPAALADKPLSELLRHLSEAMAGRIRVPIEFQADGNYKLPSEVQIALYRIAQETLNNVAKHAGATHVWVTVHCQPQSAHVLIRDDGCGFDPHHVLPDRLGLGIMHERARSIDALLEIDSLPGQGTHVAVTWRAGGRERSG